MTKLILVRHAQSMGNQTRCFTGQTDVPLTPLGEEQAILTAEFLKNEKIDVIYSSDLSRAIQTAEPIARSHDLEIHKNIMLREINAGEWEGNELDKLETMFPEDFHAWKTNLAKCRCTGGESISELADRVYAECIRIAELNKGLNVCIVTHATPIRTLRCTFTNTPLDEINSMPWVTNASVTVIEIDDAGRTSMPIISEDSHLKGLITSLPKDV